MGIFQLPNLRFLTIRFNPYLTGYYLEFQSGSQLELLLLGGTNFSGQLAESIGNLKSLKEFDVAGCNFSRAIPSSLGNLTKLNSLHLCYNKLHGPIPGFIYRLQNPEDLCLSFNFVNRTLDLNLLLKFRNLVTLQLSGNNLYLPNSQICYLSSAKT
uniref:Leucine-rich repeat-containing N-terminal plant-type domain-containing protein n=1 Tax=Salix viminalis TaxID=40686 RepID=A0A6N2MKU0_SALVM